MTPSSPRPIAFVRSKDQPGCVLALLAVAVIAAASGCQTPSQPAFGATVPPPPTGMIGQPAPYASYVSTPQGAAYPPGPPMPGPVATTPAPSTTWQSAVTPPSTATAAPPASNSWSWAQTGNQPAAPSLQQYGNQLSNQFNGQVNQAQQNLAQQTQQLTNQWQANANQYQQQLSQQPQQWANQAQATANQYQQQFNQQMQQAANQTQQSLQQAWPSQPTQQTSNGQWWPFTSPSQVPPARATPALPTKY